MTLTEALISLVVLAFVALGTATVAQMRANQNMSVGLNAEFDSTASALVFILNNKKLCTEALGNGISAADEKPFSLNTDFKKPMRVGSGAITPTVMVPAVNTPIAIGLKLTQVRFTKIYESNPPNYVVNLHLEARKSQSNGKPFVGAPLLTKDYLVNISVNGGLVSGCN